MTTNSGQEHAGEGVAEDLSADLRAVGYTDMAAQFPKDDLGLVMIAAWVGVAPDQLPRGMKYDPNSSTAAAWRRVAAAARGHANARIAALEAENAALVRLIRSNWQGQCWRAITDENADEVRAILGEQP